uniref:Uncharacterized protein n=1 Tax=Oryza barthii TaxID=65489 RepID=A0A0D3G5A2_9ORYZ
MNPYKERFHQSTLKYLLMLETNCIARQPLLSFLTRKIFSNYHLLVRSIVSSMLVKELFTKLCVVSGIISRIVWRILHITIIRNMVIIFG